MLTDAIEDILKVRRQYKNISVKLSIWNEKNMLMTKIFLKELTEDSEKSSNFSRKHSPKKKKKKSPSRKQRDAKRRTKGQPTT